MASSKDSPEESRASDQRQQWYNRGYIPHLDSDGPVTITYRLADSLPAAVLDEIRDISRSRRAPWMEKRLDEGAGLCVLERPECAEVVEENLYHFDGERYRLRDWVVMPNHVHATIDRVSVPLDDILYSWRSYTSKKIQAMMSPDERPTDGRLWQRGYFDRDIRAGRHFWWVRCYILMNPVQAGLVDSPWDWPFSSAKRIEADGLDGPMREWFRTGSQGFYDVLY